MAPESSPNIPATEEELATTIKEWYQESYRVHAKEEATTIRDRIQGVIDQLPSPLDDHVDVHKFQSYFDKLAMKYGIPNIGMKQKKATS